jgi:hypothetical protein
LIRNSVIVNQALVSQAYIITYVGILGNKVTMVKAEGSRASLEGKLKGTDNMASKETHGTG